MPEHKESFASRLAEMTMQDDNSAVRTVAREAIDDLYFMDIMIGLRDGSLVFKERPFTAEEICRIRRALPNALRFT